jgi:hypothetical protein
MKVCRAFAVLSLLAVIAAVPVAAWQDKPQQPAPGGPEMEAMMKAMQPGENHKHLARYAGNWTFTNKMWMDPSQPPSESSGTMHGEMILGGRYAQTHWQGNFMGMPFEGRGTEAYDNMSKQYVSSWIDNMGTGILLSTGTCENDGKVCTMSGDMLDPMSGQKVTLRSVVTWLDDNSFRMEMYGKDPAGKEFKTMEMLVKKKM